MKPSRLIPALAIAVASLAASPAAAIDTDPLDYVAPPAGLSAAALYYGDWSSSRQYAAGSAASSISIRSTYGVLTYVRFFDLLGFVAGAKVVVPAVAVTTASPAGGGASGSGIGDPTLVFPVWLYGRASSRTHFAITPRVQLPLGAYAKDRLSVGENRFTFALQPGFTTGLTERLSLDVVGDVQLFGGNDDIVGGGRLTKSPLFSVQTHITYELTPGLSGSIGGYQYWGGATEARGVRTSDPVRTTTVIAGLNYWVTKSTSLQFQYRTDAVVESGPEFDGFQFRFLSVF